MKCRIHVDGIMVKSSYWQRPAGLTISKQTRYHADIFSNTQRPEGTLLDTRVITTCEYSSNSVVIIASIHAPQLEGRTRFKVITASNHINDTESISKGVLRKLVMENHIDVVRERCADTQVHGIVSRTWRLRAVAVHNLSQGALYRSLSQDNL